MKLAKYALFLICFALLQWAIRLLVASNQHRLTETSWTNSLLRSWRNWDYIAMVQSQSLSPLDLMWKQAAFIKIGKIDTRSWLVVSWLSVYPDRRNTITKAALIKQTDNIDWTESVLASYKAKDKKIWSLIYGLRASLYCDEKRWIECGMLADASITDDPSAALGRGLRWIAMRQQKRYNDAKKALDWYFKLGGYPSPIMIYYHWVSNYYTRNFEHSTWSLLLIKDDPQYGFDSMIFLWRNYYDLKDYKTAWDRFNKALYTRSTGSVLPYLRLGRIATIQKKYPLALVYYLSGYDLFPNNTELIGDLIQVTSINNNTALLNQFKNAASYSVWNNITNYQIIGTSYRNIKEYDLAQEYIRKGIALLPTQTNKALAQEQSTALYSQLHHLLIQEAFHNLAIWASNNKVYQELEIANINSWQIAFMQGLDSLINNNETWANIAFWRLPFFVSSIDRQFILARYTIFMWKTEQANQIIKTIPKNSWQEVKIARLQRAIATLQNDTKQAQSQIAYIDSLKQLKKPNNNQDNKEAYLRNQAYSAFRPRINRISSYLYQQKI